MPNAAYCIAANLKRGGSARIVVLVVSVIGFFLIRYGGAGAWVRICTQPFGFRDRLREGWGAGRLVACYSLQCVLPEQGGFGRNQTAVSDLVVERAVVG